MSFFLFEQRVDLIYLKKYKTDFLFLSLFEQRVDLNVKSLYNIYINKARKKFIFLKKEKLWSHIERQAQKKI